MVNNNARERRILMAWTVRKGKHLLHAGTTASTVVDMFIKLTEKEPKALVSDALHKFTTTGQNVKVKGYSLKWE